MILSEKEKEAMLAFEIYKSYKKGEVILNKGHVSEDYYFIIIGGLRCYYEIDGEEKTTAFYTESDVFFLHAVPRVNLPSIMFLVLKIL